MLKLKLFLVASLLALPISGNAATRGKVAMAKKLPTKVQVVKVDANGKRTFHTYKIPTKYRTKGLRDWVCRQLGIKHEETVNGHSAEVDTDFGGGNAWFRYDGDAFWRTF